MPEAVLIHLDRIRRIYFGLVFLYPVHPACQGEAF
jgi:hypothetical protein